MNNIARRVRKPGFPRPGDLSQCRRGDSRGSCNWSDTLVIASAALETFIAPALTEDQTNCRTGNSSKTLGTGPGSRSTGGPGRLAAVAALCGFEADRLRTFPERRRAKFVQIFQPGGQRDEMVASKLTHLAFEMDPAIGKQYLGFAYAAGV